ncbi:MAG: hypothetical protein PHO37_02590 [Kiritimatiellae bacterium]|nr:hypothetical protein [Kiritimatiellia bacterium]
MESGIQLRTGFFTVESVQADIQGRWKTKVGLFLGLGLNFAIGASDGAPNQWRYDGQNPPTGFPGIAPEWGESSFDEKT